MLKLDELLFCLKWPFPLLLIVAFMAILGFVAYKTKHLTFSGAVFASVVGTIVLWCTRFEGFSVLIFFYCSSYLVGFVAKTKGADGYDKEKKGSRRDMIQVLANGLVCTIAALVFYNTNKFVYLVMFGASLAESTADTWAGEIGRLSSSTPVSIATGKPVEKGTSGGVTVAGLAGGLTGSALTAGFWQLAFSYTSKELQVYSAIIIGCGFFGCVLDSFFGATVQAMYEDSRTGKLTEHDTDLAGNPQKLVRGFRWIDNDTVNLVSNVISALVALVVSLLF